MVCGKPVCNLKCKTCKVFDLENRKEDRIKITWNGVKECLAYLIKQTNYFDSVVGIDRGGN